MSGPPGGFPGPFPSSWTGRPPWIPTGPPSGFIPPQASSTHHTPHPSSISTESFITSSTTVTPSAGSSSDVPSAQTNSPVLSDSQTHGQQSQKSSTTAPIVGGVVGALILLALLLIWRGLIWFRRRKRQGLQDEKLQNSPVRERGMEAGIRTASLNTSATPYSYNRTGEIVSATTLTSASIPPWSKKTEGYGVDPMLVAHTGGVDAEAQSLARSASVWTSDSNHTSSSMSSAATFAPSSPGGTNVSTSTSERASITRSTRQSNTSQANKSLEPVMETSPPAEDFPPPYQQDVETHAGAWPEKS